jgi:hypothetical protein
VKDSQKWVTLPIGESRNENEPPGPDLLCHDEKITYLQGELQTCLFDSVASALDYKGMIKLGRLIHDIGIENAELDSKSQREVLLNYMEQSRLFDGCPKVYCLDRRNVKKGQRKPLDPLTLSVEEQRHIYVMQLLGKDGHVRHAVTLVDGFIFDTNSKYPLVLCKESLDWCCNCEGGLDHVYFAYRFILKERVAKNLEEGTTY